MNRFRIFAGIFGLLLFVCAPLGAQTWFVDATNTTPPWDGSAQNPYQTIQEGIDSASTGDTVLVMPGTYVECIDFKSKGINVQSNAGAGATIIDGGGQSSTVAMLYCPATAVLDGFQVTNGTGRPDIFNNGFGGGIYVAASNAWIINNEIMVNNVTGGGGGIFVYTPDQEYSSVLIRNNTISDNSAAFRGAGILCKDDPNAAGVNILIEWNNLIDNGPAQRGGGIACYASSPAIEHNLFDGNFVQSNGFGGGIDGEDSSAAVRRNRFTDNSAMFGGAILCDFGTDAMVVEENRITANYATKGGAGIYTDSSVTILSNIIDANILNDQNTYDSGGAGISCGSAWENPATAPKIINNIICGNRANYYGAGICCFEKPEPILTNNTIVDNECTQASAGRGGGLCLKDAAKPTATNTIFWNNTASKGHEIAVTEQNTQLTISYSDVQGGQAEVYAENPNVIWGTGMIDADPLFVNLGTNDLHLTWYSPCINGGNNLAPNLAAFDFEGDPRIPQGDVVDMGADEYYYHLYYTGTPVPGGSIEVCFVGIPNTLSVTIAQGSSLADPPIPTMYAGLPLMLQPPLLGTWNFGPIPATGVLVIPWQLPSQWVPGSVKLFQALLGPVGNPNSWMTNLMSIRVR